MIRYATHDDVPRLVEMGRRFLRESPYGQHFAENPEQMARLITDLINGSGGVVVIDIDNRIQGMLGYIVYNHFISGDLIAGEVFWWVEPEARGNGIRLLKVVERDAKAAGAKALQMIAPNTRVAQMYDRLGYTPVELSYQRPL